jgi:glycerol-3-phosphate acyltransferase PlsY
MKDEILWSVYASSFIPHPSSFLLLLVGAYLLGAIPNGLLLGFIMGRNPLKHGSGKTGTANTLRVLGRPAAAAVLVLDLLKGLAAVIAADFLVLPAGTAWEGIAVGGAGAAAIVGHNWSLWVRLLTRRWGGGRGIVTALGAMLWVHPLVVLAAVLVGALALAATRYVVIATLAGIAAGVATATALGFAGFLSPWLLPGVFAWGLLVVAGFADSIKRLLDGVETRLGR